MGLALVSVGSMVDAGDRTAGVAVRLGLLCLLALHSPDGLPLLVYNMGDLVVKPAEEFAAREHLAKGTRAVVYVSGRGYGVKESVDDVMRLKRECGG